MSSFEKSVKGATKIKLAAPKSKYVEHILVATHAGEQGVAEVFRVLQNRLRDSTWTIVFKSLIIVHFMIREGEPNVTLRHLSSNPARKLAINNFTEGMRTLDSYLGRREREGPKSTRSKFYWDLKNVQTQGRNIKAYAEYLVQRVNSYATTKVDFVRAGEGRLTRLSVDKGLLRETESVQEVIKGLLRCDFLTFEPENDISLTAFRLLVMDLLVLFHVMNEGMVNILQHFFEMSKPDAQRVLNIYRTFVKQTDNVVKYLSVARNYEHVTRLEIPTLKHAPTVLTNQLEDYVKDSDFEVMRQQYMAQQGVKKGGIGAGGKTANGNGAESAANRLFEEQKAAVSGSKNELFPEPKTAARPVKGPAPDMIDFFESIEQNQTQMNTNPFQQPGFGQQNAQPQATGFGQQNAQPTGFGQQNALAGSQNVPPQATGFNQQGAFGGQQQNAFMQQNTGIPQQQSPFGQQPTNQPSPFGLQTTGLPGQQPQQTFSPVAAQATGNPFAPQPPQALQPNFTGAGFGGYTPATQQPAQQNRFTPGLSSIPQNSASSFQPTQQTGLLSPGAEAQQQSTNPFRQSMLPSATGAPSPFGSPPPQQQQNTNPFAKPQAQNTSTPPNNLQNPAFGQPQAAQPLVPAATGTNPFARPLTSGGGNGSPAGATPFGAPGAGQGVTTHVTGSTNPFRQSQFVNQSTGLGWQTSTQQGTIGGFSPDQIQTNSIFPRPGAGGVPPLPTQQQQNTGWGS